MSDNKFYHRPAVDWCFWVKHTLFDLERGDDTIWTFNSTKLIIVIPNLSANRAIVNRQHIQGFQLFTCLSVQITLNFRL